MPLSGGLAAVNSVGLGGVVGHILLRSHSKEKVNGGLPTDDLPRLLLISGRTEEGLKEILTKLESKPVDVDFLRLLHDIYSKNFTNYNYRGYTILGMGNKHMGNSEWGHILCSPAYRVVTTAHHGCALSPSTWFFTLMSQPPPGDVIETKRYYGIPTRRFETMECEVIVSGNGVSLVPSWRPNKLS
uniref:Polyketide synthase C-terminal extension domain-containing protein n=1 Tax=Timema cristinae TaxID=61476 RepID=A0A7R9H9W1_TIMCR|nr:unnamed protein product [Timema cristinae]